MAIHLHLILAKFMVIRPISDCMQMIGADSGIGRATAVHFARESAAGIAILYKAGVLKWCSAGMHLGLPIHLWQQYIIIPISTVKRSVRHTYA